MAYLFSASATSTLTCCSSTNTIIPKLSKFMSSSDVLANSLTKLQPYDIANRSFFQQNTPNLIVCFSPVVARAYVDDDSGNTREDDDDGEDEAYDLPPDSDSQDNDVKIEIEKPGTNSRIIRSKVVVQASLQTVWDILTDYERLADFIPGLAVSKLLEKKDKFARLFQIGEQNLAFGLKFNAKGTIDCFEKDLETLPFSQKRDIDFKMVEGDFQLFEGKWSVEQVLLQRDSIVEKEFQTTLFYAVHVKPKVWLPVRLVEGRLCNEIRTNLSCIRKEAEKAFQKAHSLL